ELMETTSENGRRLTMKSNAAIAEKSLLENEKDMVQKIFQSKSNKDIPDCVSNMSLLLSQSNWNTDLFDAWLHILSLVFYCGQNASTGLDRDTFQRLQNVCFQAFATVQRTEDPENKSKW
ncbi:hypothetical protein RFI_34240, partial [Reticulomyxa filosa]